MNHKIDVYTYNTIPSTNDEARQFLLKTPCEKAVFVARGQTAGKGRLGRKFYSPVDTGIYMTYVFRVKKIYYRNSSYNNRSERGGCEST